MKSEPAQRNTERDGTAAFYAYSPWSFLPVALPARHTLLMVRRASAMRRWCWFRFDSQTALGSLAILKRRISFSLLSVTKRHFHSIKILITLIITNNVSSLKIKKFWFIDWFISSVNGIFSASNQPQMTPLFRIYIYIATLIAVYLFVRWRKID